MESDDTMFYMNASRWAYKDKYQFTEMVKMFCEKNIEK